MLFKRPKKVHCKENGNLPFGLFSQISIRIDSICILEQVLLEFHVWKKRKQIFQYCSIPYQAYYMRPVRLQIGLHTNACFCLH